MEISVPEELYNRMKKHPDVNWSQIACKAFHRKMRPSIDAYFVLVGNELHTDFDQIDDAFAFAAFQSYVYRCDITVIRHGYENHDGWNSCYNGYVWRWWNVNVAEIRDDLKNEEYR